jgi:hypothetical protein
MKCTRGLVQLVLAWAVRLFALGGAVALSTERLLEAVPPQASATLVGAGTATHATAADAAAAASTLPPHIHAKLVASMESFRAGQHMDCSYPSRVEWWRSLTAESVSKLVRDKGEREGAPLLCQPPQSSRAHASVALPLQADRCLVAGRPGLRSVSRGPVALSHTGLDESALALSRHAGVLRGAGSGGQRQPRLGLEHARDQPVDSAARREGAATRVRHGCPSWRRRQRRRRGVRGGLGGCRLRPLRGGLGRPAVQRPRTCDGVGAGVDGTPRRHRGPQARGASASVAAAATGG